MTGLNRRQLLSAGLVAGLVPTLAAVGAAYGDSGMPLGRGPLGSMTDRDRQGGGSDHHGSDVAPIRFASARTVLRDSSPRAAGLDPAPIAAAAAQVRAFETAAPGAHPLYPGAVGIMGYRGTVVQRDAIGQALLYADGSTMLPESQRVPMTTGTVFDLASVSKLFTSITVVQLIERGVVRLEEPVATYLPEFAANGKGAVTVRELLTHTSGFVSWLPLWSAYSDMAARIKAVMDQPLDNPPGTVYLYSDLNLISLGVMVERLTGQSLDAVVRDRITAPLGMSLTGYNPADREGTAATEYQTAPPRGMVRGEVHDENAWSLGGVAGHAGVFSTVDDLAVLSQALLNGGTYRGNRILSEDSVRRMVTDFNTAFPGDAHGLGFELDQRWYMEGLSGPQTAGHTGYTGTSIVIDFAASAFAILLTNRVHPSRSWGSTNGARRAWAQGLAMAQPVRPSEGRTAWFTGTTDATTSTLTAPLRYAAPAGGAALSFDVWLAQESTDPLTLEVSADGGSSWAAMPFDLRDRGTVVHTDGSVALSGTRRWMQARATLPAGTDAVRWRMVTDPVNHGRGVYVDGVLVVGRGILLDGERHPEVFVAQGWAQTSS